MDFWIHLSAGLMIILGWVLLYVNDLSQMRYSGVRTFLGALFLIAGLFVMIFGGIFYGPFV